MDFQMRPLMLIFTMLMLASCDRHPGCRAGEVNRAFACVKKVLPDTTEVVNRMDVFCVSNTRPSCVRDVDACTIGVGSGLVHGRMVSHVRVPVGNAIAHEAEHWQQVVDHTCLEHTEDCGWDDHVPEAIQRCIGN